MMVLGATDRLSCILTLMIILSKFYFSGRTPFSLGHSPGPAFSGRSMSRVPTNELFPALTDFGVWIPVRIRCRQSNTTLSCDTCDTASRVGRLTCPDQRGLGLSELPSGGDDGEDSSTLGVSESWLNADSCISSTSCVSRWL
jgi:hypothetical protein